VRLGTTERRVAREDEAARERAEAAAEAAQVDEMREKAQDALGAGLAQATGNVLGGAFTIWSGASSPSTAKGVELQGGAKLWDAGGTMGQAGWTCGAASDDANAAQADHAAQSARRSAEHAHETARDAQKLVEDAIGFLREYVATRDQARKAAVHGA
jgi:hypothetical protein